MIFWHSGSGNSYHVAERIAHLLGHDMRRMLPGSGATGADCGSDTKIIWVFPIYSWGMPPLVREFMSLSQGLERMEHYMVCTCGDDVGLTHESWRRMMRRKGWRARGAWSVQMPNNYVLLPGFDVDPKPLEASKLEHSEDRIAEVARGISCGAKVDSVERGAQPWIKSRILYPLFIRFLTSPRPFHATAGCISCGKCSRICPVGNITMKGGAPEWGESCTMCLGCYHVCPCHAVAYGKITRRKGQYFFNSSEGHML